MSFKRLPWDQYTIPGWIGMLTFLLLSGGIYFLLNTVFLSLFASICEFHKVFYLNTKRLLSKLDDLADDRSKKRKKEKMESIDISWDVQSLLCEIISNNIKGQK